MKRSSIKADLLRNYRTGKGLTQKAMGRLCGVPELTIQRAENGERLNPTTIKKIAEALGMKPEKLTVQSDGDPETAEVKPFRKVFADYLRDVRESFAFVEFGVLEPYKPPLKLPRDRLYVPPRFSTNPNGTDAEPMSPALVRGWGKRIVYLAPGGYGKSSLVDYLTLQLAGEFRNDWRIAFDDAIPLPLVLRNLNLQGLDELPKEQQTWERLDRKSVV